MKSRRVLLNSLLQTLVDEWGRDEVIAALTSTKSSSGDLLNGHNVGRKLRPSREHSKPSAKELIEQSGLDGPRKEELLKLAERYEHRQFLPSIADVREFLIMMDEKPDGMKDRREAFRKLLLSLTKLSLERLRQLNKTAQHSGPSELGPLSDAISAASGRLSRHPQPDDVVLESEAALSASEKLDEIESNTIEQEDERSLIEASK